MEAGRQAVDTGEAGTAVEDRMAGTADMVAADTAACRTVVWEVECASGRLS